jgi:hypothetical protein
MRLSVLLPLLVACGNDAGMEPDATQAVDPRVIEGGGIGDGPIRGVANLYVIDESSRMPVANATVRVGTVDGTTDATGLFVARGAFGPQTVVAKASGYRSEIWVGANGANITLNLQLANPAPPTGTLTTTVDLASTPAVATGHTKVAIASYSQTDALGEEANEIDQGMANTCFGAATCNLTVKARTGKIAVIAAIIDYDPATEATALIGWAYKTGVTVTANGTQAITLTTLPQSSLQNVTISFGSPPSALTTVAGLVGIETPDGTLPLQPAFTTPASPTIKVPKLDAIAAGATYRLTGFATNGQANPTNSIVLRRGLTGTSLSAGEWLAAPSGTPTRTGGSWTAAPGGTVHGIEYKQGATRVASILVLDTTSQITLPDMVTLPSGTLTATLQAIGAPGLDVGNFSLDADRAKLSMIGGVTVELN